MKQGNEKKVEDVQEKKVTIRKPWTPEETGILKEKYEKSPKSELFEILPGRSWHSIRAKAIRLKLKRTAQPGWRKVLDGVVKKGFEDSRDPKLTPEDRKRLKFNLVTKVNQAAVKENVRVKKWGDILRRANKLGFVWGVSEDVAKEQLKLLKDLWDQDILLAYLIERRNISDMEDHFGEPITSIEKKLPIRIGRYELISYRNTGGKPIYYYREREDTNGRARQRIWTSEHPRGESGKIDDGCLTVSFPTDLDWRQIRILPLAELHFGTKLFDEERFLAYLALARHQYHFFIINGGFFGIPPKGKTEDKIDFLLKREDELRKILWPVAHKILWAHQGCTEKTIERNFDFDPLANVCRELGIPYFKRPVMAEVLWGRSHFSFYCIHGTTTAKKRGSMINAVASLLDQFEKVDFIIMSHQKSGKENVVPRIVRDRVNCMLRSEDQHLVITPSFRRYEGSEEERKGQAPPAQGSCAIILFPDGGVGFSD